MRNADDLKADLLDFTCEMFWQRKKIEFLYNWHHEEICETLESVFLGDIKRLIINIPPRYSKTEIAVINFIAWSLAHYPDCEFIHASYSKRLATNNAYNCRALVQSSEYQLLFDNVKLKGDSKAKDEWRTEAGGIVYATGADGTITGYGAGKLRDGFGGAIIIDDPHKAGEATSETMRQNVIDWFSETIESRTNTPDTPIIVIMQRLHEEDLSGYLLAGGNGEKWEHLNIPVIDDKGRALWDVKHSLEKLKEMEVSNPYVFAGQYMQRPAPKDGGVFKERWFKERYNTPPLKFDRITQSWDTAYKTGETNDPSCCSTWGQIGEQHYLLEVLVFKGQYPTVKRYVKSQFEKWKPSAVLIEDKASGQSLIQEYKYSLPIIAIPALASKEIRAETSSDFCEAGLVFLPESAPWLVEFEAELFVFPVAKHDDQVDSMTQYLNWARGKKYLWA